MPPRSWVDKDTGHRVWRLSDEANSGGFYFNINAYTPDDKQMIYTAPDGIHVLDMTTHATKLLVANPPGATDASSSAPPPPGMLHTLVVGHKTNSVFYTATDKAGITSIYKADTNTGAIRKLVDVPQLPNTSGMSVVSVNADETLIAGTYLEGNHADQLYGQNGAAAMQRLPDLANRQPPLKRCPDWSPRVSQQRQPRRLPHQGRTISPPIKAR